MKTLVVILHDPDEQELAESLAKPIEEAGYKVWHTGKVVVGDQIVNELSKSISNNNPIVICGTKRAAGSVWVNRVRAAVLRQDGDSKPRIFVAQMEGDAYLENLALGTEVAKFYESREAGITQLRDGLLKHFPIRKGPQRQSFNGIDINDQNIDFDDWIVSSLDYSLQALRDYRAELRPEIRDSMLGDDLDELTFLGKSNLAAEGKLFAAGYLLFGNRPEAIFPTAYVRCVRYSGKDKTAAQDGREFYGPLLTQIGSAMDFITTRIGRVEIIGAGDLAARFDYEFPVVCIREVLANALCHRDYKDRKRHTHVRIFQDRIEVASPGKWVVQALEEGKRYNLADLQAQPASRNERLAAALRRVKIVETEGSGIPNAIADCQEKGADEPIVLSRSGITSVEIFPRRGWSRPNISRRSDLAVANAGFSTPSETLESGFLSKDGLVRVAPSRLPRGADHLFGREEDLEVLEAAWQDPTVHVVTLVAWGGVGKSALVAKWQADLAARNFDGADYFDWSFYSQGTREQGAASGDIFVAQALKHFGDPEFAESAASPWDKGARLAALVAARRTLLILDGLEPLQYPPGPLAGQLKDPALAALLKGLAAKNEGLCVVTTRVSVEDLASFRESTAPERKLGHLSTPAGVALLGSLGVVGAAKDIEQLVADLKGHALTLNLLGRYLKRAHGGDVRQRDRVKWTKADAKVQGGHAFKTMAAYEGWLRAQGKEEERQLAVLRLLGLFDRTVATHLLEVLRQGPAIEGLTEPLMGIDEGDFNETISILEEAGLLTVIRGDTGASTLPQALDAHPLLREYFADQLRTHSPATWQAAHGRLFDHLCETTEFRPDTLPGLQPLYQAVVHGCLAGRQEEACDKVYRGRILRGTGDGGFYSTSKLGAIGADLGAIACFFDKPWSRVSPSLSEANQAWLLNEAAFRLRALGRLKEALEPMRTGMAMGVQQENWREAAIRAGNLSELELTLGQVEAAVADGRQAVTFADRSEDAFLRMAFRTTLAEALRQARQGEEALALFQEAEALQAERQPEFPLLYSLRGFQYCDLLLAPAEREAWRGEGSCGDSALGQALAATCSQIRERAEMTMAIAKNNNWLLDIALDHLSLGRATLLQALLEGGDPTAAQADLEQAMDGLRRAGTTHHIPKGLLSRSWLRFLQGDPAAARADLDEAQDIAARSPMPLFLADIHLYRARLFHDRGALAEARRLIEKHGYGRRVGELEDAERGAVGWGEATRPFEAQIRARLKTASSRSRSSRKPEESRPMPQAIQLLFFAANPTGTAELALGEEARQIETKIRSAEYRDALQLSTKWATRSNDLLQYLNQIQPEIVHFSGHGTAQEEILLLAGDGKAKPVSNKALSSLFQTLKDNIRLVVLNACFSRPQAEAIVQHIDCAIGMKKAIGDPAAITFSAAFYRAIGFGRSIQEAFDQGRTALLLEGIPEEDTPELLLRDGVDASQVVLIDGGGSKAKGSATTAGSGSPAPKPGSSAAAPSSNPRALKIWQDRLAFFQEEEAKTSASDQKFALKQQIEECRQKIREYGGEA